VQLGEIYNTDQTSCVLNNVQNIFLFWNNKRNKIKRKVITNNYEES